MNNIAPSAERPLQGTDTIRSQVILRTLVALVLIVVTVSLAIGLPLYFDLKERNQKDIQALTDAEVVSVKQYVARLQGVAEQVTSRTQIRKKLAAFNAGQVTEPELVEYTEPKLRDALSKAADAVGITRLDATRQPVVTVGVSVPTDWLETLDLSARRTVLFGPRRIDGDQTIIVASPILGQEDDPIGYDLVLFDAEPLEALVRRGTELGETAELLLTYREGQRLHPLFGPLEEESERFLLRLSGDVAAGHAADDRLDYPCCPDCVVAIRAVEETGWLLVLRIERGEVDAILNAMFERLLLISAMVLMVGMTGVYLLTGPLLRRLDRELEVHQGMVRALEQSDAQLRTSQRALERDIEQRKALEQRLNREHEALEHERGLLKTLVQTLPQLIWLKGPDGSYLACNAEFERFFGAPEADIVGKTDYHFMDRDLADGFREHDDKTMSGDSISVKEEWVTYRSDGRRVLLETTKLPMKDGRGQLTGVLGIGHDVTQRKLTEQALRESTRRYEAMLASTLDGFLVADTDARIWRSTRPTAGALVTLLRSCSSSTSGTWMPTRPPTR
jgi:PAS domain S-box-containing protein